MARSRSQKYLAALCCALALVGGSLTGCSSTPPQRVADVIVVGAGIAGLAAALEAAASGAQVLVIEANSVGGGHAVKAGGMALIDTPLQRARGIEDSVDLAVSDFYQRGVDPDPYWTRYYAEHSATDVYAWLTDLGVQFKVILATPEDSVPRFHFTRGTAVNIVVPMMRKALLDPRIQFAWNTRVTALAKANGKINGVFTSNERDGTRNHWEATATVITTGGFQNNLAMVRANWPAEQSVPPVIYKGAGQYATGDGYRLAAWAGAELRNMDRQVTFFGGVPDPNHPHGETALYVENPAAIWLAANGRRFVNESADSKTTAAAVSQLDDMSYWLIFDSRGSSKLNVRDAFVLDRKLKQSELLADPKITVVADDLPTLARKTGLPAHGLLTSIETWNRMVELGSDFQFGRFQPANRTQSIRPISAPPYFALRVYPLTRKSMGGPVINLHGQVTDADGTALPGLYAAGELTGVAGINGAHGGAGTFLGPAVLTGRVAGRSAATAAQLTEQPAAYPALQPKRSTQSGSAPTGQAGFWHYEQSHRYAADKGYTCERCHSAPATVRMADTSGAMLERLNTCTSCH